MRMMPMNLPAAELSCSGFHQRNQALNDGETLISAFAPSAAMSET
jgi:hypothetical protein